MDDAASREPGSIDVVVVGGGPTGVETTGALAELMLALHKSGRLAVPGQITLVDLGDALLGQFSDKAHGYALDKLTEAGADVGCGSGSPRSTQTGSSSTTAASSRPGLWSGEGESRGLRSRRPLDPPRPRWSPRRAPDLTVARLPRCLCRGRCREHPVR